MFAGIAGQAAVSGKVAAVYLHKKDKKIAILQKIDNERLVLLA